MRTGPDAPDAPTTAADDADAADLADLAGALADVGRAVRDAVRAAAPATDTTVVRTEGGDDVFGVDERAERALFAALDRYVAPRWPGTLIMEGFDDPQPVGRPGGPWVHLVDPVDGTRPYLAGLRSAWVVLGAGRGAASLEDLEVGAAVEIPTARAAVTRVAWAQVGHPPSCLDEPVGPVPLGVGSSTAIATATPHAARPVVLAPTARTDPDRTFVTVVRLKAGDHGPIGAWADRHLADLEVYDDLVPCSAHHLMAIASGASSAVLDPRPLLNPAGLHTHPYDLAAIVVYRAAGVIVEALPAGPLTGPLDPDASVAWAAYANHALAARLRPGPGSFSEHAAAGPGTLVP